MTGSSYHARGPRLDILDPKLMSWMRKQTAELNRKANS